MSMFMANLYLTDVAGMSWPMLHVKQIAQSTSDLNIASPSLAEKPNKHSQKELVRHMLDQVWESAIGHLSCLHNQMHMCNVW